jgi:hypothetical protein
VSAKRRFGTVYTPDGLNFASFTTVFVATLKYYLATSVWGLKMLVYVALSY